MSKIKALITALCLSTTSVALADPSVSYSSNANGLLRPWEEPARPTWTPLSQMLTAQRYTHLQIAERRDDLTAIQLKAGAGATYVYAIYVYFDNGTRQDIPVGKWLYGVAPQPSYPVARDRGGVDRIIMTTWSYRASTFQVLGRQVQQTLPPPPPPPPPPMPPVSAPPSTGLVIAKDISFANTHGYVQIPVGTEKGRFQKVRLVGTGAATYVDRIHVTFGNGEQQVLTVGETLHRGQTVELELEGKSARAITAITIMADHDVHQVGPSASKLTVSLL